MWARPSLTAGIAAQTRFSASVPWTSPSGSTEELRIAELAHPLDVGLAEPVDLVDRAGPGVDETEGLAELADERSLPEGPDRDVATLDPAVVVDESLRRQARGRDGRLGLLLAGPELRDDLLRTILATGGLPDEGEDAEHVRDRVGPVGALGRQDLEAALLELRHLLVVDGLGLDDDEVGVRGEDGLDVGLLALADVGDPGG